MGAHYVGVRAFLAFVAVGFVFVFWFVFPTAAASGESGSAAFDVVEFPAFLAL